MSSFLDEVAAEVKHPGSQQCGVQRTLEEITDPDVRDGFLTAVRAPNRYTAAAIERALKGRGVKLQANVITKHRRDDCLCPPELKPPKGD